MRSQFLFQIKKTKNLKVTMNEFSPNIMSDTIGKYIAITFSIVNNPSPRHPHKFITENYSSMFMIMHVWAPTMKSPAKNSIPRKSLTTTNVVKTFL